MTKPGKPDPDQPEVDAAADTPPDTAADTPTDTPADTAKNVERETIDEPLMAELEKAPPPPEEPVMPTAREAAARQRPEVTAPTPLRVSFFMFALISVLGIANGVLLLINKQATIDDSIRTNETDLTPQEITNAINAAVWILLVSGVVFGVLFTLLAYKARDGAKKARTLLAVISVIVVLLNILLVPTLIGQFVAILAIVATVLLFLPSVSKYFRERVIS